MNIIPQKRCSKCGETKPLTEFHKRPNSPDGRRGVCAVCKTRAQYYTDPPRLHHGDLRLCATCKETKPVEMFRRSRTNRSGYESSCLKCSRANARAWKARNKDRIREYEREKHDHLSQLRNGWREKNRDRYLAKRRVRDKSPKWRLYARLRVHQRRVAKNGTVTPDQVQELQRRQKKCYYCGKPFSDALPSTLDHVIPLAKGGLHDISNIVLACRSCNCSKNDRLLRLI